MVFDHPDMDNPLHCGAFNLSNSAPYKTAEAVLLRIGNLLQSYQKIDGRRIHLNIQLLSAEHVRVREARNQGRAPHLAGGLEADEAVGAGGGTFPPNLLTNKTHKSLWCPPEDERFHNRCLLAVAIYGYYYNAHHKHLYDKSALEAYVLFGRIKYASASASRKREMSQKQLSKKRA